MVLPSDGYIVAETGVPVLVRLGLSRTFESEPHYRALAAVVMMAIPLAATWRMALPAR